MRILAKMERWSRKKGCREVTLYQSTWYIDLVLRRQGSAKISFKIGGQKYETKVNVKKYKNPIKYISMTGVKYGKKRILQVQRING